MNAGMKWLVELLCRQMGHTWRWLRLDGRCQVYRCRYCGRERTYYVPPGSHFSLH